MPDLPSFPTINGPAKNAVAVTPSDTDRFGYITRGLYVGGTGNVTVIMSDNSAVLFTAVPAGTILPIMVAGVKSTGTTASSLIRLW